MFATVFNGKLLCSILVCGGPLVVGLLDQVFVDGRNVVAGNLASTATTPH